MATHLPYTGKEFLDSLDDGREVWIYGERIKNIAEHPAFRNTARMVARVPAPSAVRTMIRARQTCFCGLLRLLMIVPSRTRSSAVTVIEIPVRITDTRTKPNLQEPVFGLFCQVISTLMSAFPSSRRVNSWLHWKQWLQAVPGRAGGAVVMATVDHTLMRGSKPHDR